MYVCMYVCMYVPTYVPMCCEYYDRYLDPDQVITNGAFGVKFGQNILQNYNIDPLVLHLFHRPHVAMHRASRRRENASTACGNASRQSTA
jgi:hypothetical protein